MRHTSGRLVGLKRTVTPAWTPASLASLYLWYDASDTSSITQSGGFVSQINDKSGNGRHAVQATGTSQPATGTRTQNGLNVLDFDGGDSLAATSMGGGVNRPYSFAVVVIPDVTTGGRIIDGWTTTPNLSISGGNYVFTAGGAIAATVTAASTSPIIIALTSSLSNGTKTYYNNTAGGTASSHTDGWAMFRTMVGQNGALGETYICAAEWSAGDLTNVFSYLNSKWAVY